MVVFVSVAMFGIQIYCNVSSTVQQFPMHWLTRMSLWQRKICVNANRNSHMCYNHRLPTVKYNVIWSQMLSLHPHQKISANAVHLTFGTLHYCCVNSTVLRFLIQHLFHYRIMLTAAVPVLISFNGQIPVKYVSLTVEVWTLPMDQ